MTDTKKDKDQEKGDEVLRRMLKTPPDPKAGKEQKPAAPDGSKDSDGVPGDCLAQPRRSQS